MIPLFADIDATGWVIIIAAISLGISDIFQIVIDYRRSAELKSKLEDVHTLVNSGMTAQLKISYIALSRIAEMTERPNDKAAADQAKKMLDEHESNQVRVDSKKD